MDDAHRRLACTVTGGQARHHHSPDHVFEHGAGRARFVWITDVLPGAMAAYIEPMMEQGGAATKAALDRPAGGQANRQVPATAPPAA